MRPEPAITNLTAQFMKKMNCSRRFLQIQILKPPARFILMSASAEKLPFKHIPYSNIPERQTISPPIIEFRDVWISYSAVKNAWAKGYSLRLASFAEKVQVQMT